MIVPVVRRQRRGIIVGWDETFLGICLHHRAGVSLDTCVSWTHRFCSYLAMIDLATFDLLLLLLAVDSSSFVLLL